MTTPGLDRPMQIRLDDDARARLVVDVRAFFDERLDLDLSDFQAQALIGFFVKKLGAPVYNQAIQDARGFVQTKLEDLEGEFYEPEDPN